MEYIYKEWPFYFKELIKVSNLDSNVAVVTLWTKKEIVYKCLNEDLYCACGQLYSKNEGISALIRNLLLNKNIRYLIVTGLDLNGSGEALLDFFKNGVDEDYRIIGSRNAFVDKEINMSSIKNLRKNVEVFDFRSVRDYCKLNDFIKGLERKEAYGKWEMFREREIKEVLRYPTDNSGFKIRSKYVGMAWLKLVDYVMRFGIVKDSEQGERQKEILNTCVVIEEENPEDIKFYDFFDFDKKDLEMYYPQILENVVLKDTSYTYGSRLRSYKGIDQIMEVIKKLKNNSFTRRAVGVVWDVGHDIYSRNPPCLIFVQFFVQEGKLFMNAYFRSNDVFDAWPKNSLALRMLQLRVAREVGLGMGSLTMMAGSAHIYERNWGMAKDYMEKYGNYIEFMPDPRGNLIIRVVGREIEVLHQSPDGEILDKFRGRNAMELMKIIDKEAKISLIGHALDIGAELQKAEIAIKLGIEYVQDRELNLR